MAEGRSGNILHYFPTFGRGEPIRLALNYFGVPYTERIISLEAWFGGEKANFEFKQIPMLEMGGKKLVQSMAILRYLCQKNNAYPTEPAEAALVEAIVELRYEIYDILAPLNYTMKKAAEVKDWYRANMGRYFQTIESLLAANPTGQGKFFVGSKATMADFVMFEFGYNIFLRPLNADLGAEFRAKAPKFFTFMDSFKATKPSLATFMNTRDEATAQYPF